MRAPLLCLFLAATTFAQPSHAECQGQNLLDLMAPEQSAELRARADAEPFARGNLWTATKDGQTVTLVGTYHLDDPRHAPTLARITPLIGAASTVLVEAGPEEERQLRDHTAKHPQVMILTDTTLPELLPPEDWQHLSDALKMRGIPGFIAAKFQPWYVSMMLAIPPCAMQSSMARDGLDARIIAEASAANIPVRALEPFDTVFHIFENLPMQDQIGMIRQSLATEDRAEDFSTTLADSYFGGETRVIWELMRYESLHMPGITPEQAEADLALMEEAMMNTRNRNWIPVIEAAAARGPVLAAFGALHLSGRDGVANLLAQNGWVLSPLPME